MYLDDYSKHKYDGNCDLTPTSFYASDSDIFKMEAPSVICYIDKITKKEIHSYIMNTVYTNLLDSEGLGLGEAKHCLGVA